MNKSAEALAMLAGLIAFLIVFILGFYDTITGLMDKLNILMIDFMVIIKAIIAFLIVSIATKIILGKIFRRIMEQKRKDMIEKMKIAEKEQK